ncbi:MAG: hypothetical protein JOZ89_10940 [Gammaproteobacteria bacterium]|nr:hypothetical protein [Gammaproteobacteria bacterium]
MLHPIIAQHLAKSHQEELWREAAAARPARQARLAQNQPQQRDGLAPLRAAYAYLRKLRLRLASN